MYRDYLTAEEIGEIPEEHLPLFVLSDACQSVVAARIKSLQDGTYNHAMWLVWDGEPVFITQDATLRKVPLDKYVTKRHRLKFWWNPDWTEEEQVAIHKALFGLLNSPWHQRLYDPLQIIGIRFGLPWLQIPGKFKICSDHGDLLLAVDPEYSLVHPSPPDLNRWLKGQERYQVYARYTPD